MTQLKDFWSDNTQYLNDIKIGTNSCNFKKYGNNLIIGKSDVKSDIFDTLVIAYRNIQQVVIPSFIKDISTDAFEYCCDLKYVDFEKNSLLEKIHSNAFCNTAIKSIIFHSHLKEINNNSFSCENLTTVIFPNDSEISSLGNSCFSFGVVKYLSIPLHLFGFCKSFKNIQLIEINFNSELDSLDINEIDKSENLIIMVAAENRINFTKFL